MSDTAESTIRAISHRIIPLLFVLYIFSYLDRVNIGFAALQMNQALGFTPAVYGFGAGLFFVGYVLFEIPSNFILQRVGARIWLARIAMTWGVVAACNAFVVNETTFYGLRFILGVAEAGFVPGMLLYLTLWYPSRERARIVALLFTATAVAVIIAGPLSGLLLQMDGLFGIAGWKWLLMLQGIPPIIMGVVALKWLPDRPETAEWLTQGQRNWLIQELASETRTGRQHGYASFVAALRAPVVWTFGFLYFLLGIGFFSVVMWLPLVVKQLSGLDAIQVSFISAIPFVFAAVGMVLYGRHSDRTNERQWHLVLSLSVGCAGLLASASTTNPLLSFAAICVAAVGMWSSIGVLWSMPMARLSGSAAVGGLALINSIGALGGFVGPYMVGLIRNVTPDFSIALYCMAACLLLAALLTSQLHRIGTEQRTQAAT